MITTFNAWRTSCAIATLLAILFFSLLIFPEQIVRIIARGEYSFVEIMSAVNYAGAVIFAFLTAKLARGMLRKYMLAGAILSFIFFGEETSWLQHYLGFTPPEWFMQHNAQGEMNLHNLKPFQGGSVFHEGKLKVDLSIFLKSQYLFQLGFFGYFFLLPILSHGFRNISAFIQRYEVPIVGLNYVFAFFIPLAISAIFSLLYFNDQVIKSALAETREFVFSLAIFSFFYLIWKSLRFKKRSV
jgi:hypothetical protein